MSGGGEVVKISSNTVILISMLILGVQLIHTPLIQVLVQLTCIAMVTDLPVTGTECIPVTME